MSQPCLSHGIWMRVYLLHEKITGTRLRHYATAATRSHTDGVPLSVANRSSRCLPLGCLLLSVVIRRRVGLAGGLVLGEVELFLNLALAATQLFVAFLVFKWHADFTFQFFGTLVGVGDVGLQLDSAFLKTLDGQFERTDRTLCGVR